MLLLSQVTKSSNKKYHEQHSLLELTVKVKREGEIWGKV